MEPYGALWVPVQSHGTVWNPESLRSGMEFLELYAAEWNHMELYGAL